MKRALALALMGAPLWLFGACSGGDCVGLCEDAQDGQCTWVDRPCDEVCGALEEIDPCAEDLDEYLSCLGSAGDVCESECGSDEINLTSCVTDYCSSHIAESACQDLLALQ